MKKQLLAAAVATAIAVPMAASADVTVYGRLHYSIDSVDADNGVGGVTAGALPAAGVNGAAYLQDTGMDDPALGYDGSEVNSHDSYFGIKGSEDLGNGLSAVFQMEFSISGDDLGGVANDHNTYVALAGNWGVAGIGQVDTPFMSSTASLELFDQTVGDYNQLYFDDIRAQDAVFYMSPNWNGFSFVAAVVIPSLSNQSDGVEATSISGTYSNGPFFATLAYERISGEMVDDLYSTAAGATAGLAGAVTNGMDYDKWRLGLGYTANGFHVGFIYEDRDLDNLNSVGTNKDSGESWQLSGSYTMGNNVFKLAYGQADDMVRDESVVFQANDVEQWTIGLDHKLSTRTKVYAAYTDFSSDTNNLDWDALSLGIVHNF